MEQFIIDIATEVQSLENVFDYWHYTVAQVQEVKKQNGLSIAIVIVISRLLNRYLKNKRTRAPAYSRALIRIKDGFSKLWSRESQVRFQKGYRMGQIAF